MTMAKNEEPRPRSKRTSKEKDVVRDEALQDGANAALVQSDAVANGGRS